MIWKIRLGILVCLGGFLGVLPAHADIEIGSSSIEFPDGSVQSTASPGTYTIGSVGPAGGWVFYVTNDGLHGLEAAPVDQVVPPDPTAAGWGCYDTDLSGFDVDRIGRGAANTEDIIRGCPWTNPQSAATTASEYVSPSGYFDWYLPSIEELQLMRENIGQGNANVGGFANDVYWSSSEVSSTQAWSSQFFFADNKIPDDKRTKRGVRAIRTF